MLKLRSLLVLLLWCVLSVAAYAQEDSPPFSPENVDQAEEFQVLGRGAGTGIVFAPNGGAFAVNTRRGIWLYDAAENEPTLLSKPNGYLHDPAFSPRGNVLAVADYHNLYTVSLWSTASRRETVTFRLPEQVQAVAFGQDAQTLIAATTAGSRQYTLRVYSIAGNEPRELFAFPHSGTLVNGSVQGDKVLVITSETVDIYSLTTGERLGSLDGLASGAIFSPNGKLIVTYNDNYRTGDNEVKIWNAETFALVNAASGHSSNVYRAAFSPSGGQVVSAGRDGALFVWPIDPNTGILHRTLRQVRLEIPGFVRMAFDPASESDLYVVGGGALRVYNTVSEEVRVLDDTYANEVLAVAIHPNGETLASSSVEDGVRIWDITTGLMAAYSPGYATALAYHQEGAWLAAKDYEGIRFLSPENGDQIARIDLPEPRWFLSTMALSPDNTRLAARNEDGDISIFDVSELPQTSDVEPILQIAVESERRLAQLIYSADGSRLFGGSADRLMVWDAETGEILGEQDGGEASFEHLALSPDDSVLAASGFGTEVTLWNADDLSLHQNLLTPEEYPMAFAFSPDGALLAAGMGDSGTTALWRVADGRLLHTLQETDSSLWASSMAFSADGRLLAMGFGTGDSGGDGTVRVWRVRG